MYQFLQFLIQVLSENIQVFTIFITKKKLSFSRFLVDFSHVTFELRTISNKDLPNVLTTFTLLIETSHVVKDVMIE